MAGPSKKKVAKKAAPKKVPTKKATAKKAFAPADKPKPTTTTTQAVATKEEEDQPMTHQLENVTADFHFAVETRGDGDCMYHAISDQLYGHQDAHAEIRATTAAFLRQHRALYRPFVPTNAWAEENEFSTPPSTPGGTTWWNFSPIPTDAEQDQAFDSYVERLALAGASLVDIVVYQDGRVPFRQEPLDGVLLSRPEASREASRKDWKSDWHTQYNYNFSTQRSLRTPRPTITPARRHRPEDRKLLRVAYYGGVHYASVRPLPLPASPKRKRTAPDRDPEEEEEDEEVRPQKKRAVAASRSRSRSPSSPPPPPVPPRQEPPPTPPSPAATSRPPPSTWRSASCPPSLGRPTATAKAKAKQRPATRPASPAIQAPALTLAVPAAAAAVAAAAAADTSPAVPAPDDDDDDNNKWRHVRVRLAGVPGGDIFISGLVRGHLTFTRAGEVLASYAVEEEEG
ncbi:MAG: hypothetical protein M1826_006552 [Phylliscum demangeonii]|nr:MAG: hypothetical protein M1826_006552 [Phylliscum demangeonii]